MKTLKKIIPLFLILSMGLAFASPASADDVTSVVTNFWDAYCSDFAATYDVMGDAGLPGVISSLVAFGLADTAPNLCPQSPDGLHHCSQSSCGGGSGSDGNYLEFRCDYCGDRFRRNCSDFEDDYQDYVSSLPASGVSSGGYLYWQPNWSDSSVSYVASSYFSSRTNYYYSNFTVSNTSSGITRLLSLGDSVATGLMEPYSTNVAFESVTVCGSVSAPIAGIYSSDSISTSASGLVSGYTNYAFTNKTYKQGASISFSRTFSCDAIYQPGSINFTFYTPVFRIIPTTAVNVTSGDTYNTSNRVTNFSMNYRNSVTNTTYNDITIVNETTNNYYDVTTGENRAIDTWSYDYNNRKYSLVLADGSLVDVTFGLDNLVISAGGVDLNLDYIVERPGCEHNYVLSEAQAPTCTTNGYNTYTCSLCEAEYTEVLFATGHNYEFVETVDQTCTIDSATLVCPGCNGTNITPVLNADGLHFDCTCGDCNESWSVAGTIHPGYDFYRCAYCDGTYTDFTGEGIDNGEAPYWSWLQRWLQNFKTWLGEKLDALVGSSGDSQGGDSQGGDSTINNVTYSTENNTIVYTDSDGEEQDLSFRNIFKKFGFIKDIYNIAVALIEVVSADAAYAESYDLSFIPSDDESGEAALMSLDGDYDVAPVMYAAAAYDSGNEILEEEIMETYSADATGGAPSITMNLGAATSHYGFSYGGTVEVLDLSWYTPYKSTVDNIVGGFLWLLFVWGLFKTAPGILSGAGVTANKIDDISEGSKGGKRK